MSNRKVICYFPMLEGQADEVGRWIQGIGGKFGIIPVLLPPLDWNDDLTPWPSGPIFKKGKSFGGNAGAYLEKLREETIPSIEAGLGIIPDERWLVGVSLAGLFAIWAAAQSDLFTRVASVSGSFWYPGFTEWLAGKPLKAKAAHISLGIKEASGRNPHLKSIADDTGKVVGILRGQGIPTSFEWTEGTHFSPVFPRLEKALEALAATASSRPPESDSARI